MSRQGSRRVVGVALVASALVMILFAALIWIGAVPVAEGPGALVGGALTAVVLSDVVGGLGFVQTSD